MIAPSDIIEFVCRRYGVTMRHIKGRERHRSTVLAREGIVYALRELTPMSTHEVAILTGAPAHTTVIEQYQRMTGTGKHEGRAKWTAAQREQLIRDLKAAFEPETTNA